MQLNYTISANKVEVVMKSDLTIITCMSKLMNFIARKTARLMKFMAKEAVNFMEFRALEVNLSSLALKFQAKCLE